MIQELRTGGAERVVVTLCSELTARGHDVGVVAAPGELVAELDGRLARPVYPLPLVSRRPTRLWAAAGRLRGALRDFQPDLIHAHNPTMALLVALATARRRRGLVSVHGVPESDWGATARILRFSGLPVVACGPGVASALAEAGCPPAWTVPNGVPAPPPPADRGTLLAEWRLEPDVRLVLVVGRLHPAKNQQLAIRALAQTGEDVRLVLVGDGPERNRLQALAAELGVAQRVVFAGQRPGRPIMGVADVNCLPSRSEGMPLAGVEAMTSGRPLVVTAVRGNRELVADGSSGLVVPADDPPALAAAIERLLRDATLAERLAAAAVRHATVYSEHAMVDGYLELYRELAA